MSKKIAYQGSLYTIEWYWDQRGRSTAKEYYNDLSLERKRKAMKLFKLLAEHGQIFDITKFRNEGDKIYAFKPKPDRFFCFFFQDNKVIVTNAFEKKEQKLSQQEKERALKNMNDYKKRVSDGSYYES